MSLANIKKGDVLVKPGTSSERTVLARIEDIVFVSLLTNPKIASDEIFTIYNLENDGWKVKNSYPENWRNKIYNEMTPQEKCLATLEILDHFSLMMKRS